MIQIGVVGCGYWGPNLVRNFHGLPNCRVAVVSDLRPGRLQFIRESYPDIAATDDYHEILNNPDITAVAIATPVTTHRVLAEEFLRAGKHVFVEKPLAHTSQDAQAMVDVANEEGKVLAVGHVFQYAPGVRKVREVIEAGTIGAIQHLTSTRINLGPPKTTVDVIWDLCPHDLSIILHLLREMPTEVIARGRSYKWEGFVDNCHIEMSFPSGATAHIHVSWLSANKSRYMQVFGENGSVTYDEMLALDGKVKLYSNGVDNRVNMKDSDSAKLGYSTGEIRVMQLEQHEPLRMECAEFINAVRTGNALDNDGKMGVRVVQLLEWISREVEAEQAASVATSSEAIAEW